MKDHELLGVYYDWVDHTEDAPSFRPELFRSIMDAELRGASIMVPSRNAVSPNPTFRAIYFQAARWKKVKIFALDAGNVDIAHPDSSAEKAVFNAVDLFVPYMHASQSAEGKIINERLKNEPGVEKTPYRRSVPYGDLPGEAEVRDLIVELRKDGKTHDQIAEALNEKGYKPRNGGENFTARTISIVCRRYDL